CSSGQERLWFLAQLNPANPAYNIAHAVRLDGWVDKDILRRAVAEIIRRHEALRSTFEAADGYPVQVIRPADDRAIAQVDLRSVPREARGRALEAELRSEARFPFDLQRGPL